MNTNFFRSACTVAGTTSLFSAAVSAQFIEINATAHDSNTMRLHGSFSMVFDTRSPPVVTDEGDLFFVPISRTTFTSGNSGNAVPFSVALPDRAGADELTVDVDSGLGSGIFISRQGGYVTFVAYKPFDLDRSGHRQRGLCLAFDSQGGEDSIPALHPGIESLPDDPADYAFAAGEGRYISAMINGSHVLAYYATNADVESHGGIYYTAGYTTSPDANPCSIADVNEDGILDMWDGALFAASYKDERLIADVNGDGQVSFADVGAFITAFGVGCDG